MPRCITRPAAFAAALLVLLAAGAARADVITFGSGSIDHLDQAGPQIEGNFVYAATVGAGWEIQSVFGNPPSALATFFNGEDALPGDTVLITRNGGGTFTFNSIDYRTILAGADNDAVRISGLLNGAVVGSFPVTAPTVAFTTLASPFGGAIDTLAIEVSFDGSHAMMFDNVNLTIPEPAPLAALAGGSVLALARRRRAA